MLIPVAFGVTIIVFFMIHLIPGDPARTILGIHATPKAIAILHQEWGLNRPLISQYRLFLDRILHGNLGPSLYYGVPATTVILQRLPATLWLIVYATVLAVLISVPLAMIAASRKDGVRDHVVRVVPLFGLGMPPFWLGILLIYVFSIKLKLFPVSGYGSGFIGHLHSMFLPALTVAIALAPVVIRSLRASMLNVLGAEYITTARSKGVPSQPAVPAARAAQRGDPRGHRARHQHRLPDRRDGDHRERLRDPRHRPADAQLDLRAGLPRGAGGHAGVRGHGGPAQPAGGHRLRDARPESAVRAVSALSFPEHPETFLIPAEHAAPRPGAGGTASPR